MWLAQLEAEFGNAGAALDLAERAILDYYAVGDHMSGRGPMLVVASLLSAEDRNEAAATLLGCAVAETIPWAAHVELRARLEAALGPDVYERCARDGEAMEYSDAVRYALEQIEQLRAVI